MKMKASWGLKWRSSTPFILTTIGMALFSDMFLFAFVVPILPFILEDRIPHSQIQDGISTLLTSFFIASMVTSPIVGWAGDKLRSRKTLYLLGTLVLATATALFFAATSFWVLVLSRVLQGASGAIVWVMGMSLCCDTVGPRNLGTAFGSITSCIVFGSLLGPPIGGTVYQFAGIKGMAGISFVVLLADLIMRLLVVEKHEAAKYHSRTDEQQGLAEEYELQGDEDIEENDGVDIGGLDPFQIKPSRNPILIKAPVLYTLRSQTMLASLTVLFAEGVLFSSFDATVSLHVKELFGSNAFQSGLLMLPLGLTTCAFGPVGGWAVDHIGARAVSTAGFGIVALSMPLLGLPISEPRTLQMLLYAGALALCGIGMSSLDVPAYVESTLVVENFHLRNKGVFGEQGPYASLNGLTYLMFSLGMAVGPALIGIVNTSYGKLNIGLGFFAGMMAFISYLFFNK